jgi:hypothetical protein
MKTKIINITLLVIAGFFIGQMFRIGGNEKPIKPIKETIRLTKDVTNLEMGDIDEYHESDFLLYNHPDKIVYFNNVGDADTMYVYNIID